jgi:hypothetical protein
MSTPSSSTTTAVPTRQHYFAYDGTPMSFTWTKPMPQGGYLGTVTFGLLKNKSIQVFDPKDVQYGKSWAYQAQDGSFLCRMFVTSDWRFITFSDSKKGNWPLISVFSLP